MIKLSDYVMQFLVRRGVRDIYLVSGGGVMHLLDSVGRTEGLRYICNHHEQASVICAESQARLTGRIAAVLATTGPGATNALSGICGAWYDSVPVIVLSGQVRRQILSDYSKLRQLGPQEVNIIPMVQPVTKFAKTVMEPETIRADLERAFTLAESGRPGPVWLDFPLDIQAAMIDESTLISAEPEPEPEWALPRILEQHASTVIDLIRQAKRPLVLLGNGVHLGRAEESVRRMLRELSLPAIEKIGGMDLLDENDPLFVGRCGPFGQRRANFALQNSDLLLCLGASLSLASIGFNYQGLAPKATKVMVNIDPNEMTKPTLVPEFGIVADVHAFALALCAQAQRISIRPPARWLEACRAWKASYPVMTPDYLEDQKHANSYAFADALADFLGCDDVVVTGNSLDIVSLYQAFRIKLGQRVYTNINYGAMGWDLPGAIGACVGRGRRRVVLVTGDGSIQLNLHELMTIAHNRLPIPIFVFSNDGYQSIRATQENFFNSLYVGSSSDSGVGLPNFEKIATAFELPYVLIRNNSELRPGIQRTLAIEGPSLCEVRLSPQQERTPRVRSFRRDDGTLESRPLEDMFPFLPREELHENMHHFDGDEA